MDQVQRAFATVAAIFAQVVRVVMGAIGGIEHWLRGELTTLGVTGQAQSVVLLVALVVLLVAALQLFGGVLRLLAVVFVALLLASVLLPLAHA